MCIPNSNLRLKGLHLTLDSWRPAPGPRQGWVEVTHEGAKREGARPFFEWKTGAKEGQGRAQIDGGFGWRPWRDAFLQQKTSGSPSAMMCLAQPSVYPDYCGCNSTTTSIGLLLY